MKLSTIHPILLAFEAVEMLRTGSTNAQVLNFLNSSFGSGSGHSIFSCVQSLSGKRARDYVASLPVGFTYKNYSLNDIKITVYACQGLIL